MSILAASVLACTVHAPGEASASFSLIVGPSIVTMDAGGGNRHSFRRQRDDGAILAGRAVRGEPQTSIDIEADGTFQQTFLMADGGVLFLTGRCGRVR